MRNDHLEKEVRKMTEAKIRKALAGRIMVTFLYDPAHVAKIKTIKGSKWHPKEKYWSVPHSDRILEKSRRFLQGKEVKVMFQSEHLSKSFMMRKDERE